MVDVIIRARRAHKLAHRTIAAGDVFARCVFASVEDARHFAHRLGWSAFKVEIAGAVEPQPTPAPAKPQAAVEPGKPAAAKPTTSKR